VCVCVCVCVCVVLYVGKYVAEQSHDEVLGSARVL